jgi:hypothetical protein
MNHQQKEVLIQQIVTDLRQYHLNVTPLSGIQVAGAAETLARQIVDSINRVEYVYTISSRYISASCGIPQSGVFDPIKAAVWQRSAGNMDEACWLTFLAINFGKHKAKGWSLAEEVYGGLTNTPMWTWRNVTGKPDSVTNWLRHNGRLLTGKFGNHRKYESLDTYKNHTGKTISSYIDFVDQAGCHQALFNQFLVSASGDPRKAFGAIYSALDKVGRFGRTAKFDYLTMLSKLGLCPIEPDRAYVAEATGPKGGIRLLIDGKRNSGMKNEDAERHIARLGAALPITRMIMQVMEDALCNWQKSPHKFIRFRG